jgi:hydrogenase maturation factor
MKDLRRASQEQGLVLCGGHTEITDAVTRPVVVCQAVGTASRNGLIEKRNIRPGNRILLTKAIAVEGTCILAREIPERLQSLGIQPAEIEKCRRFLYEPGISIVPEARIAVESGKVTAMHDVTEGGLATALEELSAASGHRLKVFKDQIPLLEETRRICSKLGVHPLGLIASGSLLIACESEHSGDLVDRIRQAGIDATDIGVVQEEGLGVDAVSERGVPIEWPHFFTDEIARIFDSIGLSGRRP